MNKTTRIIILAIALCIFISTLVLTNDNIKDRFESDTILPLLGIASMILVLVTLLLGKKNKL